MKKTKKAFTLVELLVVIAILAILATVSILGYTSFTKKAKESNAKSEMAQFYDYVLAYTLDGKSPYKITIQEGKDAVKYAAGDTVYVVSTKSTGVLTASDIAKETEGEGSDKKNTSRVLTSGDNDKAIVGTVVKTEAVPEKSVTFSYSSVDNKVVVEPLNMDAADWTTFKTKLNASDDLEFTGTFSWEDGKLVYNYQDVKVNFGK